MSLNNKDKARQGSRRGKRNQAARRKQTAVTPGSKGVSIYAVEEPAELLPFLLQIMPNRSRNSVKSILTRGQVSVDGKVYTQHNHPLKPGQTVGVLGNQEAIRKASVSGLTILHEDKDIIVINKEAG